MISDKKIFVLLSFLLFISGLFDYHSFINRLEYIFYGLIVIVAFIHICNNKFRTPKGYFMWLIMFVAVCGIATMSSPYIMGISPFLIGLATTLIPFIYFVISYNYWFTDKEIFRYINQIITIVAIMNVISLIETFVLHSAKLIVGFVGSSIFWFQYLASINNQVIILCIALYKYTGKSKYIYLILLFLVYSILSIQLKTYVGLVIIWIGYAIIYNNRNAILRLFRVGILLVIAFVALMQIPQISRKVEHYNDIYAVNTDGVARTELYNAAFNIANDYFPFGTGQGTFGSIPANMYDSRVYDDYGLEYVWGLSRFDDVNFRMDTHWSSIIGENGFVGTLLYTILFLFPLIIIKKYRNNYREYYFIITMCYIVTTIESITLNLVARVSFIVIYSGLSAIMLRRISSKV